MSGTSRRALLGAAAAAALTAGCHSRPPPEPAVRRFPDGFLWGAATSAYQVEGAATVDGRGESIWDRFSHTPGKTRNGHTGDVAVDHYHRYAEDVALMAELGLRSYRFSLSWPRVQPAGAGRPNPKGLDFYRRLVDALRARHISPLATLFHWDLPQALQDRGGWEARDTAYRFADYATVVYDALGDAVPTFLTINEPKTVVQVGYTHGAHAPGIRDPARAWVAAHHLLLAHGLAVQALRASGRPARVGPALNLHPVYPAVPTPQTQANVRVRDGVENRFWLDGIRKGEYPPDTVALLRQYTRLPVRDGDMAVVSAPVDLLAVQYYNPLYVGGAWDRDVPVHPTSAASWQQIYPDGLFDILTRVARDYGDIPIVITENGVALADAPGPGGTVDDPARIEFLRGHLTAAHRAVAAGVRLTGYYAWSLMDNFEWAEGYDQRWGLVYVDYPSLRRIPKSSARWYSDVIRTNGVRG